MPSQNRGTAYSTSEALMLMPSKRLPRFQPARMPMRMPTTSATTSAVPTSRTVGQKASAMTCVTGLRCENESPRSSTSRLPMLVTNWLWSRLSGSVDEVDGPAPVLGPDDAREDGLVEAQALAQGLLLGLADVARQQAVDRVAGQHPEQEEVEDRDGDQRQQRAAHLARTGTSRPRGVPVTATVSGSLGSAGRRRRLH